MGRSGGNKPLFGVKRWTSELYEMQPFPNCEQRLGRRINEPQTHKNAVFHSVASGCIVMQVGVSVTVPIKEDMSDQLQEHRPKRNGDGDRQNGRHAISHSQRAFPSITIHMPQRAPQCPIN